MDKRSYDTWILLLTAICIWHAPGGAIHSCHADEPTSMVLLPDESTVQFPIGPNVINVQGAPYRAKGDGVTDDTDAIQRAIDENVGHHRILYFPSGTYLVSRTLTWPKRWKEHENWGFTWLQGESTRRSVIRLKDRTCTDPANPGSIMMCGGFGSADWFHCYLENLTFDIGNENPGAIGLQFYSNNSGAIRNCIIRSQSGQGLIGLDLGHRDMNGPLLVRRILVDGFRRGIHTAGAVNSQTLEHITLHNQSECGLENEGQSISIRKLSTHMSCIAVRSYGTLVLMESDLRGAGDARSKPAIINYNGGKLFLRDVQAHDYGATLRDMAGPDAAAAAWLSNTDPAIKTLSNPSIVEYASHPTTMSFEGMRESLRLKIEETPETNLDPLSQWATVDQFGADPTGQKDSSTAFQQAIDSGATTLFCPGNYALRSTVVVRKNVRRILGTGGWLDYNGNASPDLRIDPSIRETVSLEHFSSINGGVEVESATTVVLRSLQVHRMAFRSPVRLFFEDVTTNDLQFRNQTVYARQLNVENEGTHVTNEHSDLWILGYKTERGGSLLRALRGGRSEIFGTISYTTTQGSLAPMFDITDSECFAFFSEVCFNGDPFATLVRETQKDSSRTILRGQGFTAPYRSGSR